MGQRACRAAAPGLLVGALRRVLLAYSERNVAVGYCQGLNYVAALLLLAQPEELAFWSLAVIVEEYFTSNYRCTPTA
eukprot:SAG11_NODE_5547_length_1529_cov_4.364336_3_plen_77_part_00